MFQRFIIIFMCISLVTLAKVTNEDSMSTISLQNSELSSTNDTNQTEEITESNFNFVNGTNDNKPPFTAQVASAPVVNKGISQILDLLRKGNEVVKLSPGNDVVLLLGNTGSGKSTLAQFLLGEGQLISEEVTKGASEYLIVGKDDKISENSTVISRTVYPDLLFDNMTRTAYYDCPGFSDTRSSAHEITATYFIKRILDSSRATKLVFVVNHHSVRKGLDRKDFILLLKHAVDFVKNVQKYQDSIALIVTKVENTVIMNENESFSIVPDEVVVESIAEFLFAVKSDINNNPELLKYGHNEVNYLLNGLLKKVDGEYTRIGIFRRPTKAGPLNKMKLLQKEKNSLLRIIEENIEFTEIDKEGFGYTVSSDSKLRMNDLIEEIIISITNELSSLGKEIENYIEKKERQLLGHDIFKVYFKKLSKTFSSLQMSATIDALSFIEYLNEVNEIISDLNITVERDYMSNISWQVEFIDFLFLVGNQSISANSRSSKLAVGFAEITDYIRKTDLWYRYLKSLFIKLSQYEVQKHKVDFISNLSDLLDLKEGIKFSEIDWNPPISKVIEETFIENYEVKDINLNIPKLLRLFEVLQQTLNQSVELICTSNMLEVRGIFVQLSIIRKEKCVRNFIKVNALHKVFIDTSFDFTGKEVQMAIVAPTWEVVGSQSILLNGQNGLEHKPSKAYNEGNGKPGQPGGPAGNFFAIVKKIVNDESLSITANGGDGGMGQNGGNGNDGSDAQLNSDRSLSRLIPLIVYNNVEWTISGSPGTNGGHGGSGGYGGYKGEITIVKVGTDDEPLKIRLTAENGAPGAEGDGGYGGRGGRYGTLVRHNFMIFINKDNIVPKNNWASIGRRGLSGIINYGKQIPHTISNQINVNKIIFSYIDYVNNYFNKSLIENSLEEFINLINIDKKIHN